MHPRLPVLAVLVGLLVPGACAAQSMARSVPPADTSATPLSPPSKPVALQALSANTLGAWAGGSFSTGDLIGNIQRAQMGLVGLRYHRLLIP
ncbi:MAG: hypothetical protein BRD26_02665, partial [Bacteroidetes bacterium QH_1_64_81]